MKKLSLAVAILLLLFALTGCMPRESVNRDGGFFLGVWHGWIAPISLIVGLFDRDVHIFDSQNAGWLYELGYYLAIVGGFGSLAFLHRSRRRRKDD